MTRLIVIHPADHVATAAEAIPAGGCGVYTENGKELHIQALTDIPKYHKIAIKPVREGENVLKYGEVIGYALRDIPLGDHVHTQNLSDFRKEL